MNWLPSYSQMTRKKNENYVHSLLIGCVACPLNWPQVVVHLLLIPMWHMFCQLFIVLSNFCIATFFAFIGFPICGLLGIMSVKQERSE